MMLPMDTSRRTVMSPQKMKWSLISTHHVEAFFWCTLNFQVVRDLLMHCFQLLCIKKQESDRERDSIEGGELEIMSLCILASSFLQRPPILRGDHPCLKAYCKNAPPLPLQKRCPDPDLCLSHVWPSL